MARTKNSQFSTENQNTYKCFQVQQYFKFIYIFLKFLLKLDNFLLKLNALVGFKYGYLSLF